MNIILVNSERVQPANRWSEFGGDGGLDSPDVRYAESGLEADRFFKCKWEDRYKLIQYFLGGVRYDAGIGYLIQPVALEPDDDATRFCVAMSASFKPYGLPGPWLAPLAEPAGGKIDEDALVDEDAPYYSEFTDAIVRIHFSMLPSNHECGRLFSETFNPSAEFITCASRLLYWDNAQAEPLATNQVPGFLYRKMEWIYTWRWAPTLYYRVLNLGLYVGKINSAIMGSETTGDIWAAGRVLYNGPTFEPDRLPDGSPAFKIHHHFLIANVDWNTFPKVDATGTSGMAFAAIYNDSGAQFKPYGAADLNDLILASNG